MHSSNHKQITGDFGEHLVMYWLSKNGYECVHVRHIGIDIIAVKDGVRLGISVKARSRKKGKSNFGFTINNPKTTLSKIKKAESDFDCIGYFAFVLDQQGTINITMLPVASIEKHYVIGDQKSQEWNTRKFRGEDTVMQFELTWL